MKLKNKKFVDNIFMMAFGNLVSARGDILSETGRKIGCGISGAEKYSIWKFQEAMNVEMKAFNEVTKAMREEHGGTLEDIKGDKDGNKKWKFKSKAMEKKLEKALEEYGEEEFVIDRPILDYNETIIEILNPMEMGALDENKIMDFSELSETKPKKSKDKNKNKKKGKKK